MTNLTKKTEKNIKFIYYYGISQYMVLMQLEINDDLNKLLRRYSVDYEDKRDAVVTILNDFLKKHYQIRGHNSGFPQTK